MTMQTKKEQFHAIRRAYRAACRINLMVDGAITSRRAGVSAMRAFTGKWDTCEPLRSRFAYAHSYGEVRTSSGKRAAHQLVVTVTCQDFMRRTSHTHSFA